MSKYYTKEEQIINALELLKKDLLDESSSLNKYVRKPLGYGFDEMELQEFYKLMKNKIEFEFTRYGTISDITYAATLQALNGKTVYFKFYAPYPEIEEKLGYTFIPNHNEKQPLIKIGASNLLNYAIAKYYIELGSWFSDYQNDLKVLDWDNFKISLD